MDNVALEGASRRGVGVNLEASPDAAILLADRYSLRHTPVHSTNSAGCDCRKGVACEWPGKHPRHRDYQDEASAEHDVILTWEAKYPRTNYAWIVPATWTVFDIDTKGDLSSFPPTDFIIDTPHGFHLAYRVPSGVRVGKPSGVDVVKRTGAMLVAPGSVVNGKRYAILSFGDPSPLPPEYLNEGSHALTEADVGVGGVGPFDLSTLAEREQERIATHHPKGERSRNDFVAAKELVRAGASPEQIRQVFASQPIGDKYRERLDDGSGDAYLMQLTEPKARAEVGAETTSQGPHPLPSIEEAVERGRVLRFEPVTARALCAEPVSGDAELLGPLLVRGYRTVVGGATGQGKTTLLLQLVAAVAEGGDFLGWQAAHNERVLVIDAEQGTRTIQRRLEEAGLSRSERVDYLRVPDGMALNDAGSGEAKALEAVLDRGYGMVVADPFYKFHTVDSNDERDAVDLMRLFDRWRERYGFAFVVAFHTRKRSQEWRSDMTLDDLFGSSAYMRGAEIVLGLQRRSDGYSRLHFFKDRDGDLPQGDHWGLLFDREGGFRRDPDDGRTHPPARSVVADYLAAEGRATVGELHQATRLGDKTIRRALDEIGAKVVDTGPHGRQVWGPSLDTGWTQVGHG